MHIVIRRAATFFLAFLCCAAGASAKTIDPGAKSMTIPNLPAHPRLLLNSQGIAEMKKRIQGYEWAKAQWNAAQRNADRELVKPVTLPPRGGNWYHWYACPTHGCSLSRGKQIGEWRWEHNCPVGKETLRGDPSQPSRDYDGCIIARIHDDWSDAVLSLGLAYQVTGDDKYAVKAREILLAYAEKYLTYPLHNNKGEAKVGGGHIGSQNLDEATRLIPMCQGADFVWDKLSEADRKAVAEKLLLPAAREVLLPQPHGIHNIQNWRNSAIGLIGFLLDDKDLIRTAISNDATGFFAQMAKGVTADGCWFERAWGYHFYTMSAIWPLAEAARNCGIDLYCPEYRRMFTGPLRLASPAMALPAFNDSGQVNLAGGSHIYELAYARYKDPLCLDMVLRSNRHNSFALWFGEPELPKAQRAEAVSENHKGTGYAMLARGKGEQATWLCMKYGPHGGGHGHPDKLNFVLYAKGQVVAVDPGTAKYGLPIQNGWFKTTLAHNTLVVDERNQKQAEGCCIAFGSENGIDYAVCDAGDVYDGVKFVRTAALIGEDLLVFIDQVKSDKAHTYDVAYHQRGEWKGLPRGFDWAAPDKPGYKYLEDATSRPTTNGIDLTCRLSEGFDVLVGLAPGEATEVITATGVGSNVADRVPVSIWRREGKDTAFVWYVSLGGKPVMLKPLEVDGGPGGVDAAAVEVTPSGGKPVIVLANPRKSGVTVALPDGSIWRTSEPFASR